MGDFFPILSYVLRKEVMAAGGCFGASLVWVQYCGVFGSSLSLSQNVGRTRGIPSYLEGR